MLQVKDLHVRYGSVAAVQGISLEVTEGEVVGVLGPNGAGKSSTVLSVMGDVPVTRGDIRFLGDSIVGRAPEKIVRRGIALVPEGRHIFTRLTVEENLLLGTTPLGSRADGQAAIDRVLERFPILKRYFRSTAGKLSGGEQQQLAIARALLAKPKLLLLDEPSLGLAPIMVDNVFDLLREIHQDGVTMLLVEQSTAHALDLSDRVYVMRQGRIEATRSPKELLGTGELEAIYMGYVRESEVKP